MAVNNSINSQQTLSPSDSPTFSAVTATTFNGSLNGNASTATTASAVTGGYVASAIGTSNQVNVSGATGNVTFSLPQSIATSSSPTFSGLTASSLVSPASTTLSLTAGSDASLGADLLITSGDGTGANASGGGVDLKGGVGTGSGFGGTVTIAGGNSGGGGNGGDAIISGGTAGTSATGGSVYLKGGVPGTGTSGEIKVQFSNVIIDTAGKTLKIRQGSNACAGTGATLVGGTVTVSTTAVATGNLVFLTCTAQGGTPGLGIPVITINNGVSFTITSANVLDTSTFSWLIIKAA